MREPRLKVVQGDFVVLPCSFFTSSPLSRLNIIWTMAPSSSPESPIQVARVPTCTPNPSVHICVRVLTQCFCVSYQVIVYDHGQVIEDSALIGRVGFTGKGSGSGPAPVHADMMSPQPSSSAGIPWSADIVLNDTRVSDAGTYRCMVNNPPEAPDPGIGELELSVVGTWVTPGQLTASVTFHLRGTKKTTLKIDVPLL